MTYDGGIVCVWDAESNLKGVEFERSPNLKGVEFELVI